MLDSTAITQLFYAVFPNHSLCHDHSQWITKRRQPRKKKKKKARVVVRKRTRRQPNRKKKKKMAQPKWRNASVLCKNSSHAIFKRLFDNRQLNKLCGTKHYQFGFLLRTDGYGVALQYLWHYQYKNLTNSSKQQRGCKGKGKEAAMRKVQHLRPRLAYGEKNMSLDSLGAAKDTTFCAVDPGNNSTYTTADMFARGVDVRKTVMRLQSKGFRIRTKSKQHADRMKRQHDEALGVVQQHLDITPYCMSSNPKLYAKYVDNTLLHWDKLWAFHAKPKLCKFQFCAQSTYQKHFDREVNKLCKPRPGDKRTLILFGDAAKKNIFSHI